MHQGRPSAAKNNKLNKSLPYLKQCITKLLCTMCMCAKLLQWGPSLCNPMDYSLPGSSVLGILQATVLEWIAMPASKRSSPLRDGTHLSYVSCISRHVLYHLGCPLFHGALLLICNSIWGLDSILGSSPSWLILQIYFGACEMCCLVAKLCLTLL